MQLKSLRPALNGAAGAHDKVDAAGPGDSIDHLILLANVCVILRPRLDTTKHMGQQLHELGT